jgi:hypothetical protein
MAKKTATTLNDDERPVRGNTAKRVEQPSPAFVSIYANDINVMLTPWDFRLRIGQLDAVDVQANEAIVTILADVRMSPPHLKKLVQVLTKQLEHYETHIGPIAMPPD